MEKKKFISPETSVRKYSIRMSILAGSTQSASMRSDGSYALSNDAGTQGQEAESRRRFAISSFD